MSVRPSWSATEIWQGLYSACCLAFTTGEMTIDTFRAKLYRLGFRGQAIESEVNLHWPRHLPRGRVTVPEGGNSKEQRV